MIFLYGGNVLIVTGTKRMTRFKEYLKTTQWPEYLKINLQLLPLNLGLAVFCILWRYGN